MPKINQEALSKVPVAVPPLAEQQRIVAKVDQLMRLCDELEAGLAQQEVTQNRCTSAIVFASIRKVG
jgi:type I restriction enzyme S subunit